LRVFEKYSIQRSMKTYPTRHPNWIDETDFTQPPKKGWTERIGISFPVAFVIVLGLHLTVLGGIYASNKLKPRPIPAPLAAKENEPSQGPVSDAFVARNAWPESSATPVVKAMPKLAQKPTSNTTANEIKKTEPIIAQTTKALITPAVPKPPQSIAQAPSPSAAPKPAPVAKSNDSALRAQFLATQKASRPAREVTEIRQAIPTMARVQPIAATNTELSVPVSPRAIAATPAPVAPSKPSIQTSTPAPAVTEYVLNGGDNLYSVSRRLQVPYSELMEANGITDPRQLRVGQKLKVPDRKSDI
jgi:LysM repeat protein